jgi:uncharacterized protein YjbI with pentapeptide repeats
MSDQDETQATTKRQSSWQASKQNNLQPLAWQRPRNDDKAVWRAHWTSQEQPWRTEPEIDTARQKYLEKCLYSITKEKQNSYPFQNIALNRADIEWLLATRLQLRKHDDLDLRGAHLRNIDLYRLPLARTNLGEALLEGSLIIETHLEGVNLNGAHLEGAYFYGTDLDEANLLEAHLERADLQGAWMKKVNLIGAHLQGANLEGIHMEEARLNGADLTNTNFNRAYLNAADLEGVRLYGAHLEGTSLIDANLKGANLNGVYMEKATLTRAHLEGASLIGAHLEGASLRRAHLEKANLYGIHLKETDLYEAHLDGANLNAAHLEGANLQEAHLEGAHLQRSYLEGVNLNGGHLECANLQEAHLEKSNLCEAHLEGCDLRMAFFDSATALNDIHIGSKEHGCALFADTHWGDVNLSVIDWTQVKLLGDEHKVQQLKRRKGKQTRQEKADKKVQHIIEYKSAIRANRQLAAALRNQGMNEEASNFSHRAQIVQRKVLWLQALQRETKLWKRAMKLGNYVFSLVLEILAGYGYKPQRSFAAYLLVIACFTTAYYILGQMVGPHLSPLGAIVFSVTSFHGRGFFPGGIRLDDPITELAALEAMTGLVIEVSLIATFTQRFFAR